MSVSYIYAANNATADLNHLISKNVKSKMKLFEKERQNEKKVLSSKFVKIGKINYVKTSDVLVANFTKK